MLLCHRHETAVLVASVLDRGVDDCAIVLDRFGLPTEEPAVEISCRLGIAGLSSFQPIQPTSLTLPAPMRPRLPDAEHRAAGVGEHGHAAEPTYVERLLEATWRPAELRPCDGLFGACDRDEVVPVRRVLVLLVDGTNRVAVVRVDAAGDLVVSNSQPNRSP